MTTAAVPPQRACEREDLSAGIVHFGVGNFHRSHQAMYLDRLHRMGEDRDWGIVGIGLFPRDAEMGEALRAQGFSYTLVEMEPDGGRNATRIGSIIDFLHLPDDPEAVYEQLAAPEIRIVSLTITEGGYNTSDVTGEFDESAPAILADLKTDQPRSVFGIIVEGLRRRRERGIAPFTVASCDNVLGNGDVTRRAITAFARLALGAEFAAWVERDVAFPNSMVDRITPVTTDAERALVREEFGSDETWPVVSEPFVQWVIEDHFPNGRPRWERAGAQLVDDVAPYELMKLRLLNGSHQAMAYIGMLSGHTYVHDAMRDPVVVDVVERYMRDEALPTVPPIVGVDMEAYCDALMVRFRNPFIRDTLARLATDASDRVPKFLLPVAIDRAASGLVSPVTAGVVGDWAVWASRMIAAGRDLQDRQTDAVATALAGGVDELLDQTQWFGSLSADADFRAEVRLRAGER